MRASNWHWLAAAAALICAAPGNAQEVRPGIEAWQKLARAGDAEAAFNLGEAYRLGRGVAVDLTSAHTWLEQAARSGHMNAQVTLGLLLFDSGNRPAGLRWLRQAADRGEPRAMLLYGTALLDGDGVARDTVTGYAYVSRAAAKGLGAAKATLEEMDEILPAEQRQEGLAMSAAKPKAAAPKATGKPQAAASAARLRGGLKRWRVQLGAFSNPSSAEALYKRLSASAPVAGMQLHLERAGALTRLQVGPFESRAAAASACAALKARGQPCFVLAGN